MTGYILNLDDPRVREVLRAVGTPYSYGAGAPKDGAGAGWPRGVKGARLGVGWDCSGFVQAALVATGLLSADEPDRSAESLRKSTAVVAEADAAFGHLAFYGPGGAEHVTLCLGGGLCIGANGGTKTTNADSEKAFVKIDRIRCRPDFLGVGRIA